MRWQETGIIPQDIGRPRKWHDDRERWRNADRRRRHRLTKIRERTQQEKMQNELQRRDSQ